MLLSPSLPPRHSDTRHPLQEVVFPTEEAGSKATADGCHLDLDVATQLAPGQPFAQVVKMYHNKAKPLFKVGFDAAKARKKALASSQERVPKAFSPASVVQRCSEISALARSRGFSPPPSEDSDVLQAF